MMTSAVYLLVLLKKEQTKRSAVKGFVKFNECKGTRCATKHRKTLRKGKTLRVMKIQLLHGTCMWYKTNFNYSSKFCQIRYIYQCLVLLIFFSSVGHADCVLSHRESTQSEKVNVYTAKNRIDCKLNKQLIKIPKGTILILHFLQKYAIF